MSSGSFWTRERTRTRVAFEEVSNASPAESTGLRMPMPDFFDAVGKRLAPFGVDVFHSDIHERRKKALPDDSFQRLEVPSDFRADAGGILSLTLQAECKSGIGGLRVVHSHLGQ